MNGRHRNLRKAAILLASLDDERAGAILAQLPADQAQDVRRAAEQLGPLDPAEQRQVIEEFFRIGPLVSDREPLGIELNGLDRERIRAPRADATDQPNEDARADDRSAPGGVWRETSVEALVSFLECEQPQTIAVVLSRLSGERAAEVLAALPAETQVEVARRVVDLEETDADVLAEIEGGLASWLDERTRADRRRTAGLTALAGILEAANPRTRANILENLGHCQQAGCEVDGPPPAVNRFEDLMRLNSASLRGVFDRAGSEVLVLALAGSRPEFAERALELVSPAKADALRRALRSFGPTRLSDIESAQQELADLATQLAGNGEIACDGTRHLCVAV